jgi:hypothetical protein
MTEVFVPLIRRLAQYGLDKDNGVCRLKGYITAAQTLGSAGRPWDGHWRCAATGADELLGGATMNMGL